LSREAADQIVVSGGQLGHRVATRRGTPQVVERRTPENIPDERGRFGSTGRPVEANLSYECLTLRDAGTWPTT